MSVKFKAGRKYLMLVKDAAFTQVSAEALATGDASTVTFAKTLANTAVEAGSITIDGDGNTETWTDNGDGTLTGSAGGSGTYNTETGAISVTFNTAPGVGQNPTIGYWYLPVAGSNIVWYENPAVNFKTDVESQAPAVGGFAGPEGVPGDFYYEEVPGGDGTILAPCGDWTNVSGEVVGTGDGAETDFNGTLDFPGIHSEAYTTGTGHTTLAFTDGTETFTDANGDGVLVGDAGGSGTINYETGAFTLSFNAAPSNLQAITAAYTYLPLPECEFAFLGGGHARRWVESNTEAFWGYTPTPFNHATYGGRKVQIHNDGTKVYDDRFDGARWSPTFKAGKGARLMAALSGFGRARTAPTLSDNPTRGLLPSAPALVNTKATLALVAKADSGDKTFPGGLVGAWEVRSPFDAERLDTSTGDTTGGTACVELNTPTGKKGEIDFTAQLEKPSDFNWRGYLVDGTRFEQTWTWTSRRYSRRLLRYLCCTFAKTLDLSEEQEALMVDFKGEIMNGLPGESNIGRDTTGKIGEWQFAVTKP